MIIEVAIGLAVGLDYKNPKLDIHAMMQVWKSHHLYLRLLEGGELLEYGARTIPEVGGLHSPLWGKLS